MIAVNTAIEFGIGRADEERAGRTPDRQARPKRYCTHKMGALSTSRVVPAPTHVAVGDSNLSGAWSDRIVGGDTRVPVGETAFQNSIEGNSSHETELEVVGIGEWTGVRLARAGGCSGQSARVFVRLRGPWRIGRRGDGGSGLLRGRLLHGLSGRGAGAR